MPNGGSDNCRSCRFNSVNIEEGIEANYPEPRDDAICVIRHIHIANALWTYCANYHSGNKEPEGPVFSPGFYTDKRIPWYKNYKPILSDHGECHVCGRHFDQGLQLQVNETDYRQFCSNNHYMRWWKKKNPGVELFWEYDFRDPEEKK